MTFKSYLTTSLSCLMAGLTAAQDASPQLVSAPPLEDKKPAFPVVTDDAQLLKQYDTEFPNRFPQIEGGGGGVTQEVWDGAVNRIRVEMNIKRDAQGKLGGKAILGEGGMSWYDFQVLCQQVADIYWKSNAEQRKAMMPAITDLLQHFTDTVGPEKQSWGQWANYGATRPQFRAPFMLSYLVSPELGDAFVEDVFGLAALSLGAPRVDLQMDHLKGYAALAFTCPPAVRDPKRRLALAKKARAYAEAVMLGEGNFTMEGGPMHHGIWHYYYARYSTFEFFAVMMSFHKAGFYFSPATYDRIRHVAWAAAVSGAASNMVYPLNGNGRSGSILPIGDTTNLWVRSATFMGNPTDPKKPHPLFGAVLAYNWPNDAYSKEIVAGGIKPAPVPDTHLTMNIGGTSVHRRNGWNIQTAGLSPATGKHEIYTWVSHNNYSQYTRWGSHIIVHPSYTTLENDGGYMTDHGFNWAFVPGATCPATPPHRLIMRRKNTYITNGGIAGGCTLDKDGMWANNHISGPGDTYKKSAFFFGDHATYLTSNVNALIPKDATEGEKQIHTTLAQWPVDKDSQPLIIRGKTIKAEPNTLSLPLDSLTTVVDSKGHAYIIAPDSGAKLKYRRGKQSYPLLADQFVKTNPTPFNWHGPTVNGKSFNDETLKQAEDLVTPREGNFEVVYIEHEKPDGSDEAGSAYHILPMAGRTRAAAFAKEIAGKNPPCRILQRDGHAHALWDRDTNTFAYAVFDNTEINQGPVISMSNPGTIMVRKNADDTFETALAVPLRKEPLDTEIVLRGHYEVTPSTGDRYEVTLLQDNKTRIKWLGHSYTATTLELKLIAGSTADPAPPQAPKN